MLIVRSTKNQETVKTCKIYGLTKCVHKICISTQEGELFIRDTFKMIASYRRKLRFFFTLTVEISITPR